MFSSADKSAIRGTLSARRGADGIGRAHSLISLSRRSLCFVMMLLLILPGGCARPRGELFPLIQPPRVWPGEPERPRIRLVGVLAGSHDLHAAVSGTEVFQTLLRGPRPPIRFLNPHAVAVEGHRVAVTDVSSAAVHVLDLDQREHFRVAGFAEELFRTPVGVAWADGRLFVTDGTHGEVIELTATGDFRGRFGGDVLQRPVGVAWLKERGELIVVDGSAHDLKAFDLSGRHLRTMGTRGVEPGQFNFPTHIAAAGERLLVADSGNFRVQLLDADGGSLTVIGQMGNAPGDLALPKGVAFDSDGHVYVVDARFENVQIFNRDGRLLLAFGDEGSDPGQFSLPAGLAIDGQDRIWVADAANRRLQVFAYLKGRENLTASATPSAPRRSSTVVVN